MKRVCSIGLLGGFMSGGHFDYNQYQISDIADQIERDLIRIGTKNDYGDIFEIPDDISDKMLETIALLRKCEKMVQAIDWYMSGDTGDDSFREEWEAI